MKEMIKFVCDDGAIFDTMEDALDHEADMILLKELENMEIYERLDTADVYDFIRANFVRKLK